MRRRGEDGDFCFGRRTPSNEANACAWGISGVVGAGGGGAGWTPETMGWSGSISGPAYLRQWVLVGSVRLGLSFYGGSKVFPSAGEIIRIPNLHDRAIILRHAHSLSEKKLSRLSFSSKLLPLLLMANLQLLLSHQSTGRMFLAVVAVPW